MALKAALVSSIRTEIYEYTTSRTTAAPSAWGTPLPTSPFPPDGGDGGTASPAASGAPLPGMYSLQPDGEGVDGYHEGECLGSISQCIQQDDFEAAPTALLADSPTADGGPLAASRSTSPRAPMSGSHPDIVLRLSRAQQLWDSLCKQADDALAFDV